MANGKDKNISPLLAGLIGAAVGVLAVVLSDKQTRNRLSKELDELKDLSQKAQDLKEVGRSKLIEGLEQTKKLLESKKKPS